MEFKRIKLSQAATIKLKTFKMRTGLTPNVSCRLAMTLSINENNMPSLELYSDDTGQEINRYTFLGDQELMLLSLFTQWCNENNVAKENYYEYLHAHINRGVEMLTNRVKGLDCLLELLKNN
ncbi:MAG: DNA sulfur modification protein DndE [Bacteriovoracaceae bacterium]|nr:DNA sulfur modification protein DndE [Bacteriovoracaceae bacterium]